MFGLKKKQHQRWDCTCDLPGALTLDSLRAENAQLAKRLQDSQSRCDRLAVRLERSEAWVSEQARQIKELEESLVSMRTQYINKLTDLGIL